MYVLYIVCIVLILNGIVMHVDSINDNVSFILKKASKRLYFLRQLKRANVPAAEMICFYCTCIRPR